MKATSSDGRRSRSSPTRDSGVAPPRYASSHSGIVDPIMSRMMLRAAAAVQCPPHARVCRHRGGAGDAARGAIVGGIRQEAPCPRSPTCGTSRTSPTGSARSSIFAARMGKLDRETEPRDAMLETPEHFFTPASTWAHRARRARLSQCQRQQHYLVACSTMKFGDYFRFQIESEIYTVAGNSTSHCSDRAMATFSSHGERRRSGLLHRTQHAAR